MSEALRPLRVFLCHSSGDKPAVRNLYKRLLADGIDPWLDDENLLPGQFWEQEIPTTVRNSDVVLVCLTQLAVTKAGYLQKEIKLALDVADEQPEGTIFLIPLKLEDCSLPERLRHLQWVNLFDERGYIQLLRSLRLRARTLGITLRDSNENIEVPKAEAAIERWTGSVPDRRIIIRQVQKFLAEAGYYTGTIDGVPGPYTVKAVRKLLSSSGLNPDELLEIGSDKEIGPPSQSVKSAAKELSIWQQILEVFRSRLGISQTSHHPSINSEEKILHFRGFLAVRLPYDELTVFASDEDKDQLAVGIAERIVESFRSSGIEKFNSVELYTTAQSELMIARLHNTADSILRLERIFETVIFPFGKAISLRTESEESQRVRLIVGRIKFHPAFDRILQRRLIVRPIVENISSGLTDLSKVNEQLTQTIIGVLQVSDFEGKLLAEDFVARWNAKPEEHLGAIDVDFDLMAVNFAPEAHPFPLGLKIYYTIQSTDSIRRIAGVTIDVNETRQWINYLDKINNSTTVMRISS